MIGPWFITLVALAVVVTVAADLGVPGRGRGGAGCRRGRLLARRSAQKMTAAPTDIEAAALRMARSLGASMRPLMASMQRVARTMRAAVWSSYRAAGMPYGETEDGFLRWVTEQQEAHEAREYAEREASIQATCAQLRAERLERGNR